MAIKTKVSDSIEPDMYMALIRRLPLRPIRNDAGHAQAVEIVQELLGHDLDRGQSDYLDTLILLVNKYEDEKHTVGDDLSPRRALRAIMHLNGISQTEMGKIIGSESAVSMFLKGERGLSKAHIKVLVARFRVDASLFL